MSRDNERLSVNTSNVLSVIMGGGQGTRLFPLTKERSKPAVPLAGKYRLVVGLYLPNGPRLNLSDGRIEADIYSLEVTGAR